MTLRYDDKSLAGRVMDELAKQQGITREDYANQIAGALPFLLAALNNPEFQNQVAGALGTFLKQPQSLTVKLQPAAPISGQEIMEVLGSAPQTLPDRFESFGNGKHGPVARGRAKMLGRIGFLFLILIAAAPARADPASEALLRAFVENIDSSPDWSATAGTDPLGWRQHGREGLTFPVRARTSRSGSSG
jgi:hypothetical protein